MLESAQIVIQDSERAVIRVMIGGENRERACVPLRRGRKCPANLPTMPRSLQTQAVSSLSGPKGFGLAERLVEQSFGVVEVAGDAA